MLITGYYIFAVALMTSLIYLWILRNAELNVEAWRWVIGFFLVGATVSIGLSIFVEGIVVGMYGTTAFLMSVLVAPVVEELAKAVPVASAPRRILDERVDGVILGGATALGFGMVETIMFAMSNVDAWQQVVMVRAVFSTPLHLIAGAMVGYGIVSLRLNEGSAGIWILIGMAFHGFFNFAVQAFSTEWLQMLSIVVVLGIGVYLLYAVVEQSNERLLNQLRVRTMPQKMWRR